MIKIWLTGENGKGFYALIDDQDVQRVTEHAWSLHKKGYARASINGEPVPMHRFIMNASPKQIIDHKNLNRLDNQKSNLRFATFNQNLGNSQPRNGRKYKGVYEEKHKKLKRFHAHATHNGKRYSFGRYLTAAEAALAYDKGITELRGEFAWLNFPDK